MFLLFLLRRISLYIDTHIHVHVHVYVITLYSVCMHVRVYLEQIPTAQVSNATCKFGKGNDQD